MKILVTAKPNAKVEKVEQMQPLSAGSETKKNTVPAYKVSVRATPTDGKANEAIIRALSVYFNVPRSQVRIVSGHTSNHKIIEINV